MAKKITSSKVDKSKAKTSQEEIITGNLFLNPTEQKTEIPIEITNSENIEIVVETPKSVNEKTEKAITIESNFSLDDTLFIEIHKSNLIQYFSSGCIFPSKYSSQKAFSDPQSINENGLLISNGFISNDKDHVLIQVDASAINKTLLSVKNVFGLYSGIIPVSRIIKLYVQDIETKKKTLDDSLIRDAGIIPETLIEVGFPTNLSKVSFVELSINPQNLEPQMNQFDKILGLIAGTRNFNLLTYNQTGKFKTFSDHSFFAVQAIDVTFATEIVNSVHLSDYYKWLFTNSCPSDRPLLQWLFNRVYNNSNFTDSDTNEFESLSYKTNSFLGEEKQIKDIFSALRKSLERKKTMINILALQSKNSLSLYVFAYLRNFGTNQNPELPRVELINSKVNKFSEYAFATLNFFFGYKQLRNSEDRLSIYDDIIKKGIMIPTKPNIKFELTTEFDYRIIDSVFNLVFDITNNDLAKYKNISVEQGSTNMAIDGYDCYSTVIFGKLYYRFIKPNEEETIIEALSKLPNEININSEFFGICYRANFKLNSKFNIFEIISEPKKIANILYYYKSDLIDGIRNKKMDNSELKQRISYAQKHKEL